ncbi:MAG: hypothetical protein VR68_07800 [Peptococcaceae bacterium BRH_c4a]|nr:MAG: hypothetical protein VR68_07800 [Peptococcaceae bacterium BRH_c4a]
MKISGIILAGGKSSRMGKNKALLEIDGLTLIERVAAIMSGVCSEIIIAGDSSGTLNKTGYRSVPDIYPGCGPLSGIHAGLSAARNQYSFIIACDMPFVDEKLMRKIIDQAEDSYEAVILKTGKFYEPLFSLYGKGYVRAAEASIEKGVYKVTASLSLVRWKTVSVDVDEMPDLGKCLLNINTPGEYEKARKIK